MPSKRPETNAEERRFMANFRCSTYHTRHREERNAKTRARMAALRAREGTLPPAEQERKRVARHAAAAKYREKWGFRVLRVKTGLTYDRNAWRLAKVAREARYKARVVREQEKAEAQMEEARHWQQEELAAKQACLELKRARKRGADAESSGRLNRRPPWLSSQLAFMWADDLADPQRGEVYVNMDMHYFAYRTQADLAIADLIVGLYETGYFVDAVHREVGPGIRRDTIDGSNYLQDVVDEVAIRRQQEDYNYYSQYIQLNDHRDWWDERLLDFTVGLVSVDESPGLEHQWVKTFWHVLSLALLLTLTLGSSLSEVRTRDVAVLLAWRFLHQMCNVRARSYHMGRMTETNQGSSLYLASMSSNDGLENSLPVNARAGGNTVEGVEDGGMCTFLALNDDA
ncbi:hypothetical protein B0H11DRAFT_1902707 [Mycena galericulata]|nr:hypothetical protein B0H11DRAFT_1902707 [Mycena galericulata]